MQSYRQKIKECIEYLNSIRFPCEDWKEDKKFYDRLEQEFVKNRTMKRQESCGVN